MIQSINLYCAPIWSLRFLDIVEQSQAYFYRKFLSLSRNVAGYLIRQEMGISQLQVKVWLQTILFIDRLMQLPDEVEHTRITRECFMSLAKLDEKYPNQVKFNWFTQFKTKLRELGIPNGWPLPQD